MRMKALVGECLGVDAEQLVSELSLTDELAVDSLDMLDLALAVESEFGIVMPESVIDHVRLFGELVDAVTTRLMGTPRPLALDEPPVRVYVVPPGPRRVRSNALAPSPPTSWRRSVTTHDALVPGPGSRWRPPPARATRAWRSSKSASRGSPGAVSR
jgi:acyl carrier protein